MSETPTQPPWTEDQWSKVREAINEEAQRARVASSFLPLVGPVPGDQSTVPAMVMDASRTDQPQRGEPPQRLTIDEGQTLRLATIATDIYLRNSEVSDPELQSAIAMFRRSANILSRLEDWIVFNGQPAEAQGPPSGELQPEIYVVTGGQQNDGLLTTAGQAPVSVGPNPSDLVGAVVQAINLLEAQGHLGPFACVLSDPLFLAANTPNQNSLVLPADRIRPFLNGPLLRSSTIPDGTKPKTKAQGVVVSLAGAPIDLVIGTDMGVRFLQVNLEPRWVFRLSQRFVLRQHVPGAAVRLESA